MTCARCGWKNIRPSPRRGLIDRVLEVFFLAPFRCRNCRHRFFRFSKRIRNDFKLAHFEPASSPPEQPPVEEVPSASPADEPTMEIETRRSILIIDDDLAIRKFLRRVLERQGYRISELSKVKNLALELSSDPVDLLITDLVLDEQDAPHAIASLHGAYPNLKIIVLSGFWAAKMQRTEQLPGVFAVLPKPVRTDPLLDCVRAALEQSAESRAALVPKPTHLLLT
jgi:ActR/RegA family two-component response regulator